MGGFLSTIWSPLSGLYRLIAQNGLSGSIMTGETAQYAYCSYYHVGHACAVVGTCYRCTVRL
jgi:hypothetical protein